MYAASELYHDLPPSYDEKRRDAPLIRCAICSNSYYMTVPSRICIPCKLEHLDPYKK